MAALKMPIRTDIPAYDFSLTLEGVIYFFSFEWNERGQYWSMDILDQDQNHLVAGVRMTVNVDLLGRFKNTSLPPGTFLLLDSSGKNLDPTAINFGTVVELFYIESTGV